MAKRAYPPEFREQLIAFGAGRADPGVAGQGILSRARRRSGTG